MSADRTDTGQIVLSVEPAALPKRYQPHHEKFSPAWYRRRRALHLRRYPDCDRVTRDNLDMLVAYAEEVERVRARSARSDRGAA